MLTKTSKMSGSAKSLQSLKSLRVPNRTPRQHTVLSESKYIPVRLVKHDDPDDPMSLPTIFHALKEHVTSSKDEKKTAIVRPEGCEYAPPPSTLTFPGPEVLKTLKASVFTPGKTYRFRLSRSAGLTSSGTGTLQLATAVLPSNFEEYTPLSGLFEECRLISTRIKYAFLSNGTTPVNVTFASCFDPSGTSSTVPSFTNTIQFPGCKICPLTQTVPTGLTNSWKQRGVPRSWSLVTTTDSGTDPVGGALGCWYHSIFANTTNSSLVAVYLIECDYEFRNVY
jgi:hypothetical protein